MDGPGRRAVIAVEGIDGAGKSTLVRNLATALNERGERSHVDRLSPKMGSVFRSLVDETVQGADRYQDVLPGGFRRAAYIVDAVVQFRYRAEFYARHDWLLFDRWLQTYDVYCDGESRHDEWYQRVARTLPEPRVLLYVKVSPEIAVERLRGRGDWTVDNWSPERLLADLRRLDGQYEACMTRYPSAVRLDGDREPDVMLSEALATIDALHAGAAA